MKNTVQLPSTHTALLTAFRTYLASLGLSSISRKLYSADIARLLASSLFSDLSISTLTNPNSYASYLSQPELSSSSTLLRRTLASLRQFGTFLNQSFDLPNPIANLSITSNTLTTTVSNSSSKYIKACMEYLKDNHLTDSSIRSYKSDITQYLTYLESHHPSTQIESLLTDKNLQNYTDLLTHLDTQSPATIERKIKTIRRFLNWYSSTKLQVVVSDNTKIPASSTDPSSLSSSVQGNRDNSAQAETYSDQSQTQLPDHKHNYVKTSNYRKLRLPTFRTLLSGVILLVLVSTLSIFSYRQFGRDASLTAAFPSTPVTPNRQLSFQGRLENASGTPITAATNFVFKLHDASSGGSELYSSGTCSITPDTDGVFSTQIGGTCGSGIASSVFTENADVWLEVTVGAETLTPRQQIATVAYALNSETLQGFPISATVSAIRNTVVPMNQWGEIIVGEQSPRLTGVSGTFQISAPSLSLVTATGTNGNITLAPDGTGQVNINGNTTTTNFFNVSNAQLTTGSLITGTAANNNTGFKLIDLLSGASPTSKFSVSDAGDTTIAGTLTLPNTNTLTGVANYTQFSQGVSVGGATTYYINSSGTANLNALTLAGTFDANGQVDLGDGGDTVSINGSSITLTGFNCSGNANGGALTTNGSGVLQCSDDDGSGGGGGDSYWRLSNGALSPVNDTLDLLIGSNATSSAKFAFTNINSGTPTLKFNQASNFDLYDSTVNSLSIEGGLLSFDTLNSRLGIGNTTPLAALDIAGSASASGTLTFRGTTDPKINVLNDENFGIQFSPGGDAGLSEKFTILSNGNVGIGVTNPTNRLEIAGTTSTISNSAGDLTIDSFSGNIVFGTDDDLIPTLGASSADLGSSSAPWDNLYLTNLAYPSAGTITLADNTASAFRLVEGANTYLDITTTNNSETFTLNLPVGGATLHTANLFNSNIAQTINIGTGTAIDTINIGTGGTSADDINLGGLSTSHIDITGITNFAGGTTYYVDASGNARFSDLIVADTGNPGLTVGDGSTGFAKIGSLTIGDNNASVITFDANSDTTPEFQLYNTGSATASGDISMGGQLQVGRFASNPTAIGSGTMIFDSTLNVFKCYNGTSWFNCGGTLFSNTNASVADGSYITVTHNLSTNDLLSSAWINAQGVWKSLESSYQPAIAWEGKDTQKGNYHNAVNSYTPVGGETGTGTSTLHDGLIFDTFEDNTKTDSANTTSSTTSQLGDDGSTNFATLDQRVQTGRVGLMGGQTYSTSETDNDGQTYLGSNTVNDIYYYDRSRDSSPEVLVELGIDPNWYNGVTLSVATSSAQYSQAGTLADKNPNLTTSYNGSLVKATGTDSTPRTIFITIKSPTTFDWTNYQGDAATGVTITPGTAQTLGSTGVSVTFTGGINYNVGDVFKIASWYIEGESATRGAKQQFPERSNVVAGGGTGYVDIIDADTQKLWMRFSGTASGNYMIGNMGASSVTPTAVKILNGILYVSKNNSGGMSSVEFYSDRAFNYTTTVAYIASGVISERNSAMSFPSGKAITIVNGTANDVDAAVIPNQPTQEMTVSGWGYITGSVATNISEAVNLPYKFNSTPVVKISQAGGRADSTNPTSLSDCSTSFYVSMAVANSVTTTSFNATIASTDATDYNTTQRICYTWTATGTVSPKQYVAVATGATSADGGTTIINETDGTKVDNQVGSQASQLLWQNKVAIAGNTLYVASNQDDTTDYSYIAPYYGVHGLQSETSFALYRNGYYFGKDGGWKGGAGPSFLANATTHSQIQSLSATPNTSTLDPNSNTIYVGTSTGVSVINEIQGKENVADGSVEAGGSVKYYTKDYISEEMIGDIRGMWPLNASNTASDLEDISYKANALTATNISSADAVSGVRNEATDFDGSTEYLSRADDSDFDFTATENFSIGAWVKTSVTSTQAVLSKYDGGNAYWALYTASGAGLPQLQIRDSSANLVSATSSVGISDNNWHHIVGVRDIASDKVHIYVDGQLAASATDTTTATFANTGTLDVAKQTVGTPYWFTGSIDEPFVTATALTPAQIKNMYQVGYRALQSHGTGLSSGTADGNQALAGASNNIGIVQPDYNNQYMYVGTNHTTDGALTQIQLNSDTAIKNWDAGDNDPDGGTQIVDDDVTSLAVGETLYAVGSAASGVKSMGVDNNSTATSGNFVSKTYTLPKNIGSAVLWASPVLDSSDGSNTLTVQASNDGGSNYVTCTLVNTNSNPAVPEKEYACTFTTADNDLKVRFQFARGSTKTNTYVVQYGISWLGETGFRVEQYDSNNVRLYNYSGETQNLKLNVTGASTTTQANPWTDGGSYLYPTGYETLRLYDGAGSNYLSVNHDGTDVNFGINGTTYLELSTSGLDIQGGKLYDNYLTTGINLGDSNNTALTGYGASSIIGALNELKNSDKNTSHNDYLSWANHYQERAEGSDLGDSEALNGLFFDTFQDGTKFDAVNSTSSATLRVSDNSYRVGITGGQTYNSSTSDNDGQTYLGSNTVNDIYYYDRSRDSSPEVLVELGIDPNWYNGVTLSVATSSAQYSQAGTLADKNPNLTTSYNGSLVKATGTDSTPRTIFITIKSPTTFDWTNYQGDAATGVTITPGTAQTLGSTGVSVTFTGGINYNVGDVFKIASWYIEGESATRGVKQQFPERSYIIANGASGTGGTDIIDADTQKLWMRFTEGSTSYINNSGNSATNPSSSKGLNGKIYIGSSGTWGILNTIDFTSDSGSWESTGAFYTILAPVSMRNTTTLPSVANPALNIVNLSVNDVDAAVIPNHPTKEVTVSGWGYIQGVAANQVSETVNLPYKFNSPPTITLTSQGGTNVAVPTNIANCSTTGYVYSNSQANTITTSSFINTISREDGANLSTSYYYCYTWTATGTVSPKQYVGVSTANGATVIDETNGTSIDFTRSGDTMISRDLVLIDSPTAKLYVQEEITSSTINLVHVFNHIPASDSAINSATRVAIYGNSAGYGRDNVGSPTSDMTSLSVTPQTSTVNPDSNTVYLGDVSGVSVIQENLTRGNGQDDGLGPSFYGSSVKYYTKDYISEEMIGDIRGMWPLNNSNTATDFEDVSGKANTLTGTNITASGDSVSGVRGTATDFDGSTEYMSVADNSSFAWGTTLSVGAWFKNDTLSSIDTIIAKYNSGVSGDFWLETSGTELSFSGGTGSVTTSGLGLQTGQWYHAVAVYNAGTTYLYLNGQQITSSTATTISDGTAALCIGCRWASSSPSNYFDGTIDEAFVTTAALTPAQIKNMYQVGYRALQSHGTGLSSGTADGNQALAGASNNIGIVQPDYNNQYMYVGTNHTTDGALTQIQLNSDTAIKNWDAGDNDPDGGTQIIDDDVTSLGVGYQLEAVGSAASGVKSMAPDNNANALTGSLFSKTQTLNSSTKFAYFWTSVYTDSSDSASAINVYACNNYATKALCDSNSAWVLGTLIQTDSTQSPPEREYNFAFPNTGSYLTFKIDFKRTDNKANTYLERYGASWASSVGGADIAERYQSSEPVFPGDIVTIDSPVEGGVATVKKSSVPYDQKVIGVVTTNPGIVMDENLVDLNWNASSRNSPDRPAVALAGRIPVNVSTKGGDIEVGDPITTSSIPGLGVRANQSGTIVAKALESFDCDSPTATPMSDGTCQGQVLAFANITHYERSLYLSDLGDFVFTTGPTTASDSATSAPFRLVRVLADGTQEIVDKIGTFGTLIAESIKGQNLAIDTISPLASGSAITVEAPVIIKSNPQTPDLPTLVVEGEIEASTISARTAILDTLEVKNIIADRITANQIEGLEATIATLSAGTITQISDSDLQSITDRIKSRLENLNSPATAEDIPVPQESLDSQTPIETIGEVGPTATSSATLASADLSTIALASADIDFATINTYLAVVGTATITTLDVTNGLYTDTISSKTGLLALGDNTLLIDNSGNVAVNGDLTVSGRILASSASLGTLELGTPSSATSSALGNLLAVYNELGAPVATIDASGSADLASLTTGMITIASAGSATDSSALSSLTGTAQSNATAGQNTLKSPNTELTIESPYVTANSLVYLTPTTNTDNKVVFVKSKNVCAPNLQPIDNNLTLPPCSPSFTIAIDAPATSDISFNWWIIELK